MRIDIWSDIVCPFCQLGKARLAQALSAWEHGDDVELVWHSFELDRHAPRTSSESLSEHIATKYGTSLAQSEASQEGIAAQFAAAGLTFDWRAAHPGNTYDAHRLIHRAAKSGLGAAVMERFMTAYFAEGAAIGEQETLTRLAVEAGMDRDEVTAVLVSDDEGDAVRADEAAATQIGINGVPFFVFDERLGLSGAQPVEVFRQALDQAWDSRQPALAMVTEATDGEACAVDGSGC